MERESFVFYRSFFEAMEGLPDDVFCAAVKAIAAYALDGEEPELDGFAKSLFLMAKPQIDANNRRYTNGRKGGRPKEDDEEKPMVSKNENQKKPMVSKNENQTKPMVSKSVNKSKPNVNVNVNENVNDPKREGKEKSETASGMVNRLTAELGMSDDMREALLTWVKYKSEKRQGYKPEGLKALITQVHKAAAEFGQEEVIRVISDCMASGYQGIIFDRLKKAKPPDKKRTRFDNFEGHDTDYDSLMWASVREGLAGGD